MDSARYLKGCNWACSFRFCRIVAVSGVDYGGSRFLGGVPTRIMVTFLVTLIGNGYEETDRNTSGSRAVENLP